MKPIYVLERKEGAIWIPLIILDSRDACREAAKYFNGFAYRTKKATHRVGRYVRERE